MGLDQYLLAKFKKGTRETNNLTGACGGIIPLAPKSDKTEIGYWRKHYALDALIARMKGYCSVEKDWGDKNCKDIKLNKSQCEKIRDHSISKIQEMEELYHGNMQKLMDSDNGWDYRQWSQTKSIMDKALEAIEEGATIYYKYWS